MSVPSAKRVGGLALKREPLCVNDHALQGPRLVNSRLASGNAVKENIALDID